jgi:hypothetical protein
MEVKSFEFEAIENNVCARVIESKHSEDTTSTHPFVNGVALAVSHTERQEIRLPLIKGITFLSLDDRD